MRRLCSASLIAIFLLITIPALAETYRQVRISFSEKTTLDRILRAGIEPIFARPGDYVDFAVTDPEIEILKNMGITYTLIHDDLVGFYQSRNPAGVTMGGYRTYAEMVSAMDSLAAGYPGFCTAKWSIASTAEARFLWVWKISDNPSQNESEPEIILTGLHHAREPISGEICIEFARYLLTNYGVDPIATNLVDNYQIYLLPCSNPDGYEYNRITNPGGGGMWRKNRRNNGGSYGVDLNRNYAYFWGYDESGSSSTPSSEVYRGPTPASEPEITGIQSFIDAHDFALVVNFHAYGDLFLYPWGYYNGYADDRYYYSDTLGVYSGSIGYTVEPSWGLYNTNGDSDDWVYGEDRLKKRNLALTIEVGTDGDGFWPPQSRIAPLINENKNILKDLLPRAYNTLKRRLPPIPAVTSLSLAPPGTQFYLHWQSSQADTFNLPTSYRVIEKSGYSRVTQTFETTAGYTLNGFTRSTTRKHNGTYSVYSGQGSDQRKYATINERLKVQPGDNLTFWTWYNLELNYDYAYIQVSTDGGRVWYEINGNLSTSSNPYMHNKGYGITGSSGGNWVQGIYPLTAFVGQEIKIRFAFWSDANVENEGIYFDDVFPIDDFSSSTVLAETVIPDSFLVGPYTLGSKWFQVEARDDRGQLSGVSDRFKVDIIGDAYSLSGHVSLSDSPVNLSGSIITIAGAGLSDTTDTAGSYSFPLVGQGTYDVIASRPGYYPETTYAFIISQDTTLDFALTLAPPAQPALLSPVNNATLDTEYVTCDWNDVIEADSYVIEIATDAGFANVFLCDSSLAVSNYHNVQPFANGSYYWRITAHNQAGYSNRSAAWRFTINVTLAAPTLVSPTNGYISDSSYMNFDWTDISRATGYIIEIARDNLFTEIAEFDSNHTSSSYRNAVPFPNDVYYWRVTAFNQTLQSPRSSTRSFTVNVTLQAPSLLAPPNHFLTDAALVNFDWNDVAGAVSYVFEVGLDSLFATRITVDSAVTSSDYSVNLADGRYFWRVTAFNGMIYSARSAVRDFTIATFLEAPALVAPSDGYLSEASRVDFDWTDVSNAYFYIFEVANDPGFASYVINDSTHSGSSYPQAGPFTNGDYYWRVTASNGLIHSQRSAVRSFTVDIFPGIPAPELLSPGDGYVSPNAVITFDWADVSDTVFYLFELARDQAFSDLRDSTLTSASYRHSDPLENGEYYWRVRASDGRHWSPYSEFWTVTVDAAEYLPGDANGSGRVNGIDVVFLVNYLKGGAGPIPYLAGDANGTCTVNGLDVVYLVNYFKGGPAPFPGNCLTRVKSRRHSAEN